MAVETYLRGSIEVFVLSFVVLKASLNCVIIILVQANTHCFGDVNFFKLVVVACQAFILVLQLVEKVFINHRLLGFTKLTSSFKAM